MRVMATSLIDQRFAEWARSLDPLRARIVLFERGRDLSYAYPASRDAGEVLRLGRGSCSGKHYLLGEFYRRLGVRVRNMLCTHRFNESPLPFSAEMQAMLRKDEIIDVHDYLQIHVDGRWIDVDATWERGLREFGFPVTENWDGRSTMVLSVVADEDEHTVVEGDPAKAKEGMLAKLSPRQRALRKKFLETLGRWALEIAQEIEQRE